jgi:hypothetical protein
VHPGSPAALVSLPPHGPLGPGTPGHGQAGLFAVTVDADARAVHLEPLVLTHADATGTHRTAYNTARHGTGAYEERLGRGLR